MDQRQNRTILQLLNRLAVVLWAVLIFTLSSQPQITVSQLFFWDFVAKKAAHLAEYAILFALIYRATKRNWSTSWLLLVAYAVSDEFHQRFVPGRNSTPLDIGFDLIGASIASYIIWKLKQIRLPKPKKSPRI